MPVHRLRPASRLRVLLLGAALAFTPLSVRAQTWTSVLTGLHAVPANDSPAIGAMTLTLSGSQLLVQLTWNDLLRFPQSVRLFSTPPRTALDRTGAALSFLDFTPNQSGTYSLRVNLTERARYDAAFLRANGDQVEQARSALITALDSGYVGILTQPGPTIEIGARLRRQRSSAETSSVRTLRR